MTMHAPIPDLIELAQKNAIGQKGKDKAVKPNNSSVVKIVRWQQSTKTHIQSVQLLLLALFLLLPFTLAQFGFRLATFLFRGWLVIVLTLLLFLLIFLLAVLVFTH